MLNQSLNQFKFDSTHFQHFFTLSTMLNDLFKRPRHLIQHTFNKITTFFYAFNNVERPVQTPPTFDSTHFQQDFNIFYAFNNVERPVQTPPTFGSTAVLNAC